MVDFGRDAPLDAAEYEEHNVGGLSLEVVEQGWSGWLINLARVAANCHLEVNFVCQEMQDAW